ncbi:MAG: hypothetical protein IKQ75_00870 [Bacteroidales bacterium]|nr:hypothetical protein [Bacteroidales bacterium]
MNDTLVEQVRNSFEDEQALERWLQEQMELALLQLYNSQRQAVLSKARQTIDAMRQHSEENGNSKLTLDEINEEIRQARLGRKNTANIL